MSDGTSPIIVFPESLAVGELICYSPFDNFPAPKVCYNFTPTNDDWQPEHYTDDGGWYNYNYVPTPPSPIVLIEPGQAIADIQSDLTLSDDIQMGLLNFLGVLNTYVKNANGVKKSWQLMIGAYGSGWLTSELQTKIQKHCADNGCPLV